MCRQLSRTAVCQQSDWHQSYHLGRVASRLNPVSAHQLTSSILYRVALAVDSLARPALSLSLSLS
jgi:hypothetical protein